MYKPRYPTLAATGMFTIWVAVLSIPMLGGKFLSGPYSDQFATGYAYRAWAAEQWHATGHVPQHPRDTMSLHGRADGLRDH